MTAPQTAYPPLLVAKSVLYLLSKPRTYCLPLSPPVSFKTVSHSLWTQLVSNLGSYLGSRILGLMIWATTPCKVHSFETVSHTNVVIRGAPGKCCRHSLNWRIPGLWEAPSDSVKSPKSPLLPCAIFRPFLFCFTLPSTAPKHLLYLIIQSSECFIHLLSISYCTGHLAQEKTRRIGTTLSHKHSYL